MFSAQGVKKAIFDSKENQLSHQIVGAAITVQIGLGGPGLLEAVYEEALVWELQSQGITVARQQHVPIHYKGQLLSTPLRLDLLVEECVIIEVKAVTVYNPIFEAQLLTYLRLTNLKLGLVINFGARYVGKGGIKRVPNNL